ncbi:type II toxin-antitoxin system PemK/MazF family toxin [Antrihabitans stalactiti]|uniref:Type II toxin-antitoxin system PemK/MazF family toxin n=1 Tax=Antrihabitans stalactiti TaxID=2584121 RepID=A0A848KD34_9NOCA|nr:type II toxin-antitoxin system PemK/MazF family toxin [Antrihabitans stalactiti]NMN94602.1 type II toxin-antitoxin system PemK/MazF family toxin [Antrihabitans stalactiti]
MARPWTTIGKQLTSIAKEQGQKVVRSQAPKLVERLQKSGVLPDPDAPKLGPGIAVRPVAANAVPTAQRARRVVYAPRLDGRADPGEVVWTWVTYEEDPRNGKDRPVLVVGRDKDTLLGLMLSSNPAHAHDRNWIGIGSGAWDHEGRPSWVRLDRVLDVPEAGIRREGAILERKGFDEVAIRLVREYSWR